MYSFSYFFFYRYVQESDSGCYSVIISNAGGQVESSSKIAVTRTHHSLPPSPKTKRIASPRTPEPVFSRTNLGPETRALKVLSQHRLKDRPLPPLEPFPFKPDHERPMKKKNFGKVPKPSKFIPGEMYHSDYDSDMEGPIPCK